MKDKITFTPPTSSQIAESWLDYQVHGETVWDRYFSKVIPCLEDKQDIDIAIFVETLYTFIEFTKIILDLRGYGITYFYFYGPMSHHKAIGFFIAAHDFPKFLEIYERRHSIKKTDIKTNR